MCLYPRIADFLLDSKESQIHHPVNNPRRACRLVDLRYNFLERTGTEPGYNHQPDIHRSDWLSLRASLCQPFYGQYAQIFRPPAAYHRNPAYGWDSDISGDYNYYGGIRFPDLGRSATHEANGDIRLFRHRLCRVSCHFLSAGGAVPNKTTSGTTTSPGKPSSQTCPGGVQTQGSDCCGFSGYCGRFYLQHTQA
ncbi:hypothetical protein ES703_51255 [subsurface metagenome]